MFFELITFFAWYCLKNAGAIVSQAAARYAVKYEPDHILVFKVTSSELVSISLFSRRLAAWSLLPIFIAYSNAQKLAQAMQ